jgi:hypothetical protein
MAYDRIDNLFLFTHPSIQQRMEEVGEGLRWIMASATADDVNYNGSHFVQLTLSQSMDLERIMTDTLLCALPMFLSL